MARRKVDIGLIKSCDNEAQQNRRYLAPKRSTMPKRKRGNESGDNPHKLVEAKIVHGKKILNKALRLARSFERQKIDKRIKLAEKEGDAKKDRVVREGEVLKGLDISKVVDSHLYKTLLKTKTIAESNLLPSFVVMPAKNAELATAQLLAYDNVTARMFNTKPVKDAMKQVMSTIYGAVGALDPAKKKSKPTKERIDAASEMEVKELEVKEEGNQPQSILKKAGKELSEKEAEWDGIDSGSEGDTESDDESKEFAGYDARIAASEDDSDEDECFIPHKSSGSLNSLNPRDLSITPSPTPSRSPSRSSSPPPSATFQPTKVKPAKPKNPPPPQKAGSTFLPTLMGGYWSGSDSSASDLDIDKHAAAAAPPRKNRRGQQARRAIAEKKFGGGAKHIKAGLGPADTTGKRKREERMKKSGEGRDKGWDATRGAVGGGGRERRVVTGENAAPVGDRKEMKRVKHRDDVGDLHASWAAAKKAKEAKVNAKFEGKKIVFE